MKVTVKEINFDMDGTIANFYGVEDWLQYLVNENPRPYAVAEPLLNMSVLARRIHQLQNLGYMVNIISWLSKTGSKKFNDEITEVKLHWLEKHLPSVHFDKISIVEYGTPKSLFGEGILFDDEKKNREEWNGEAFDERYILEILKELAKEG